MHNTFLDRLQRVLGGRKPHPWAAGVGWTRGVVDSLKDGGVPSPEFLAALGRAEGVSLNWMLTGEGQPFRVAVCVSDAQAASLVSAHLADSKEWQPFLLQARRGFAVVLTLPAQYQVKDKAVDYTAVELVAGAVGPATILTLDREAVKHCDMVNVSDDELLAMEKGEIGTHELTRSGGILSRRRDGQSFAMVRDTMAHYCAMPMPLDPVQMRILDHLQQLGPEDVQRVEDLVERLKPKI